jgi:hypothetical protein
MPSHSFRFDEVWDIPDATPAEVYDVLARGKLLPLGWKGVYMEAELFEPGCEPMSAPSPRQRFSLKTQLHPRSHRTG